MNHNRTLVILEALFAVLAWGGSFVATKIALKDVHPVTVVWLRFGIGVAILGVAVVMRKQWAVPARRDLLIFAGLGAMGITFHQWLQSTALVTAQAITTAWIVTTSPVFIAVLGVLVLKEGLGWLRAAGIALAAAGVMLVISKGNLSALVTAWTLGDFLILVSAVNWAVFSVLSRGALKRHPASRMMFYVMGFGWLFSTFLFLPGPGMLDVARLSLNGWLGILFLGVCCSGLAYIAWYDALQALPASQAGAFLYIEPLITMVIASLILSEAVLWTSILGGAIILAGVWIVNRR